MNNLKLTMETIYRKVEIKSEQDLPKEEGRYISCFKKLDITKDFPFYKTKVSIRLWLEKVDWYLQPIEPQEPRELHFFDNEKGDVSIEVNGNMVGFALPANYSGVLNAMQNDKKIPRSRCTEDQAQKVAWRIVKDWVEAQMAIVEAQLADITEVFLPYAITKSGNTLYKEVQSNGMLMLSS